MKPISEPDAAFFMAMRKRMPSIEMRSEGEEDFAFVQNLFIACSPMAGSLPEAMLIQQAQWANDSFRSAFPNAMRAIAAQDGKAVGRMMIDWDQDGKAHGVDLAVMPHARKTGLGLYMLQSWLEVADKLDRPSSLDVLISNPAIKIYRKLGFVPSPEADGTEISLYMERPARDRPI